MSYFPAGFSILWDGQSYRPIVVKDHTRLDGSLTKLVEWETECPGCGRTFQIKTGLEFNGPRRRCDDCKVSGRTVRADRKLFRQRVRGDKPLSYGAVMAQFMAHSRPGEGRGAP